MKESTIENALDKCGIKEFLQKHHCGYSVDLKTGEKKPWCTCKEGTP